MVLPFYHHGVIHGDPHPNYLIRKMGQFNLILDGIRHFLRFLLRGYSSLLRPAEPRALDRAVHAFMNVGGLKI